MVYGLAAVKKGRRSHDKDTGMFVFTFLTITSFPATHVFTCIESPYVYVVSLKFSVVSHFKYGSSLSVEAYT